MKELIPYLIVIAVILMIPTFLCLYVSRKTDGRDRAFMIMLSLCFFLFGTLPLVGALLDSTPTLAVGFLLPSGLMLVALPVHTWLGFRNCTEPVRAKCTGFRSTTRYREVRIPTFCYRFNGETIEMPTFLSYPRKKFDQLFKKGELYTIHINPNRPKDCVDKRYFPWAVQITLFVIGAICLLASLIFLFLIR